jgi:hypothetical protein
LAIASTRIVDAQAHNALLVPPAAGSILGVGLVLKASGLLHRLRSSASARRRTSSQGMPSDWPDSTPFERLGDLVHVRRVDYVRLL